MLDAAGVGRIITRLADAIEPVVRREPVVFIGIITRGVTLAHRVAAVLKDRGHDIPVGTFDISLYRDDFDHPERALPNLAGSDIDFALDDRTVMLFDEVIHTGRTVRAALEGLMDHGRARVIRLVTLVDRGHREIPIQPDYVGLKLDEVTGKDYIRVSFDENDQEDSVVRVIPV